MIFQVDIVVLILCKLLELHVIHGPIQSEIGLRKLHLWKFWFFKKNIYFEVYYSKIKSCIKPNPGVNPLTAQVNSFYRRPVFWVKTKTSICRGFNFVIWVISYDTKGQNYKNDPYHMTWPIWSHWKYSIWKEIWWWIRKYIFWCYFHYDDRVKKKLFSRSF